MAVPWVKGALAALAVWAVALAGVSPARAYTVKQTDNGSTVRWHTETVSLRIDPSMRKYFSDMPVDGVLREAATAWMGLPNVPDLMINAGEPGPRGFDPDREADNGIYLVKDWTLAASSLAVTVATFESKTGKIVDTDILVNANHPFALMPDGPDQRADAFDLRGVLTHEMGHVLGLGESFDVRMATMWPNIARGETHQRDIDVDDEDGAQKAYAEGVLSDRQPAQGCGRASVVMHRSTAAVGPMFWVFAGFSLIAVGLWMRTRARKGRGKALPMLVLVLLFGGPLERGVNHPDHVRVEVMRVLALTKAPAAVRRLELALAARSDSPQVRMTTAAVLESVGAREDASIASRLAFDSDEEVRKAARRALERLRTAPPAARIAADALEAKTRLEGLLAGATRVVVGEAVAAGVEQRGGLIWSKYLVHGAKDVVAVDVPGGSLGGFTQVLSEQEPPADGDTIVVALRENGAHAWAHMRDGVVYGGHLGEGPAIRWQP